MMCILFSLRGRFAADRLYQPRDEGVGLRLDAGGLGFARTGHVEDEVGAAEGTEPAEDAVEVLCEYHEMGKTQELTSRFAQREQP